jgi:hypothetical protein
VAVRCVRTAAGAFASVGSNPELFGLRLKNSRLGAAGGSLASPPSRS